MFIIIFHTEKPFITCMSVRTTKPPTLELRLGRFLYEVKKTQLLEKFGLFQDSPALLGGYEYAVKSRVPRQHFEAFLRIVDGDPLVVSESTRRSFSRLAREFGFDELSAACKGIVVSDGKHCPVAVSAERARVIIVKKKRFATYEALHSRFEVEEFVRDLAEARERDILLEGIDGRGRLLERAVGAVYANTVADFPDRYPENPFLAYVLWSLHQGLCGDSLDTCAYCLNLLHAMAPTGFDKARLLLLSQSDSGNYGSFIPVPTADWKVISDAVRILQREKNGKTAEAKRLLRKLKETGQYDDVLERWASDRFWTVADAATTRSNTQGDGMNGAADRPSWFRRLFMTWFRPQSA